MAERAQARGAERRGAGAGRLGGPGTWLVAFLILATAGCHPLDDVMVAVFGRSMREQPSLRPYEAPHPPPEGSVPFAAGNFPPSAQEVALGQAEGTPIPAPVTAADVLRALAEPEAVPQVTGLENPVAPDAASLERGQVMYERTCVPCHGAAGDGAGPVAEVAAVFGVSLLTEHGMGLNESYLYSIIRAGRGAMPSYGHQISHYDRWHVVNYVLQLQGRLGEPPEN